ncbi:DNRLRE domain-containing protein [Bacillus pacificus]|nr:DNRLRE domain-containing protein [Bacillus pacificus]
MSFIAQTDVGRGKWAQFNVTNTVKAWVDGARPNNGFKLHAIWWFRCRLRCAYTFKPTKGRNNYINRNV